jgi:ribosomal protein S18 acetylase RimI-like enzyme
MTAARASVMGLDALVERRLGPDDLDAVEAFHAALHRVSPEPGLFVREARDFFARHLGSGGRMVGLFDPAGRLVCYSILGLPDADSPEHFGHAIGMHRALRQLTCHLDGTAVSPEWRGQGLQRRMTLDRIRHGATEGRPIALSTAAPRNIASLTNLTACGLRVVALVEKYDSHRLILRHDTREPPLSPILPKTIRRVPLDGAKLPHLALLADGWLGVAVSRQGAKLPTLDYIPGQRATE